MASQKPLADAIKEIVPNTTFFKRARIHLVFAQEELAKAISLKNKRTQTVQDFNPKTKKRLDEKEAPPDIRTRVLLSMAEWSHIMRRRESTDGKANRSGAAYVNALKKRCTRKHANSKSA